MRLDAVIFGGGAAGLWLLDRLVREGHSALLLESGALGSGQTICSQGIIHGGMKYSLSGLLTKSAKAIRQMPGVWRDALLGRQTPNLTHTRLRSSCCYLWQTESLASRAGMLGARIGLQVRPEVLSASERPGALERIRGTVARLDEQVVCVHSFLKDLATQHQSRLLHYDPAKGCDFELTSPGDVRAIHLKHPETRERLSLFPRQVIFTAGAGNVSLRKKVSLDTNVMQRRPLHMVLVRGDLPELHGHCVDGARTRVTITSDHDTQGRVVWQVGGQLAEDGVRMNAAQLTAHARAELEAVLPSLRLDQAEWSTYTIDRAEGVTSNGQRPESVQMLCAGNVTTGWPTKLALAPVLAQEIAARVTASSCREGVPSDLVATWPRPPVACVPWNEADRQWWPLTDDKKARHAA